MASRAARGRGARARRCARVECEPRGVAGHARRGERPELDDRAGAGYARSRAGTRECGSHVARSAPALTIVGGKGGVGKSTVACALALTAAAPSDDARDAARLHRSGAVARRRARREPWARDDVERRSRECPGSSCDRWTRAPRSRACATNTRSAIDALFERSPARGVDIERDRAILRDLLALAPPGIDELYALSASATRWPRAFRAHHRRSGADRTSAATARHAGDRARLDAPAHASDAQVPRRRRARRRRRRSCSTSRTAFARVGALLRDPARASLIAVTLDEPLVRAGNGRLTDAVGALGVRVGGVIWNRVADGSVPAPLPFQRRQRPHSLSHSRHCRRRAASTSSAVGRHLARRNRAMTAVFIVRTSRTLVSLLRSPHP